MSASSRIYKNLKTFHFAVFAFALLLIAFCFRWQGVEAAKFSLIAKGRVSSSAIESIRGSIYSSDGTTMAYSEPRCDAFIWMEDLEFLEKQGVQTRQEFLAKTAPILGISTVDLEKKIHDIYEVGNVKWIPVIQNLDYKQCQELKNLKTNSGDMQLRGMQLDYTSQRIYPEGRLASHVIGLSNKVDKKFVGVSGIELYWSDVLNPIKGFTIQEHDARGSAITAALLPTIEPKSGSSLYTAINKNLQRVVEEKLKQGVEKFQAKSGTAIIMDPKTGEIMAMANFPDYDPNKREETDINVYGNLAVTAPYETGSTGKALTVSAAIELGVVTPDTIMPAHNGCEKIHDDLQPLCTWDKQPKPEMTVRDCFANSDNICFYRISQKMNNADFYKYLDAFGVGKPSGIDLKEESIGRALPFPEEWTIGDVSAFSYGHGYLLNPVQATDAYASIANYGVKMKPYIVTKVINKDGDEKIYKPQPVTRVLKKETTEIVNQMMANNYSVSIRPWEWYYQDLLNYNLGTKTGTALVVENGVYTSEINSTMIGYDMSPLRTFVMYIKLEKPQGSDVERLSSNNVRIVWLETFAAIKEMLGVPRK